MACEDIEMKQTPSDMVKRWRIHITTALLDGRPKVQPFVLLLSQLLNVTKHCDVYTSNKSNAPAATMKVCSIAMQLDEQVLHIELQDLKLHFINLHFPKLVQPVQLN